MLPGPVSLRTLLARGDRGLPAMGKCAIVYASAVQSYSSHISGKCMKQFDLHRAARLLLVGLLTCWLSACTNGTQSQAPARATPPAASILLGPQPCPGQTGTSAYWASFVHPTSGQSIEGVSCGYLTGQPLLQAVIALRSQSSQRQLALSVFTDLGSSAPVAIFHLADLSAGEVKISAYNTLLTSEQGWQPFQNEQILHTLTREFRWSERAQTLIQVGFVGLYPDATRYQAEAAQQEVNASQGDRGWQLDAVSTARFFAEFLLQWPAGSPATLSSGGGTHDARAVVRVTNPALANAAIEVSLSRLELNTNGGIWEVTDVATRGMALTVPGNLQQVASPASVTGSVPVVPGEHPVLVVLNDEHTIIGQQSLETSGGGSTVRTHVAYTSPLFAGKIQEGAIALYLLTADQQIAGCVMVKVLLHD